ncbi:hypothetical protein ACIRQH_19850 [Streptomyces sp. NPDC102279]|uniref:hypothetical protein n=1 Tax=Streptomyces sp. NPDC102279 TaxID=3366153 RepID=UPI003804E493
MGPLQWGDVPTTVGVVFAGAAAWFGYQTIKSQRQQIGEQRQFIGEQLRFMSEQQQNLSLERAELRAAAETRRWAQARQVRAWMRKASWRDQRGHPEGPADHWEVSVTNESEAPIHHVDIRFGTVYTSSEAFRNPPRRDPSRGERTIAPVPLVGARNVVAFVSQQWASAPLHNNRPTLYFTDDAGTRWSLDSYGKLEEVAADAP